MPHPTLNILVSVIMPVYNVASFLEEAIESVLSQSLQNFELILVNDGSTDQSAAICKRYEAQYAQIRYYEQKNSGVSVARNNGLIHARGEYVFFMDSDDTVHKNFLQSSYHIAQKKNYDIVLIGKYYLRRLPHVYALPACGQMIRLAFLNQHADVRFPQGIQPCEDGLFSHQLLALSSKMGINPVGIYLYRQHNKQNHVQITQNVDAVLQQIPQWLTILEQFYQQHQLFQSHARHLALFIEHEPFGLRYLALPLNEAQKEYLHGLIQHFMAKNVLPYLKPSDKKLLKKSFLYFLSAHSSAEFDAFYSPYITSLRKTKRRYMLLTKLVFINSIKQRLRRSIEKNFDL